MKYGLIRDQSFRGNKLMVPPSRILYKKIGLPNHETYRFVGYKTSILRHLIDCGNEIVSGEGDVKNVGFTVQVRVDNVMKKASEEYVGRIQSAAFGAAGEAIEALSTIGTVLDGISVAGMVGEMLPEGEKPPLMRPGRFAGKRTIL